MLSDFDMIMHTFPRPIDVYPIADVHLGAVEHAEAKWREFIKKVLEEKAYIILAGDLLNNATRGTRFANPFDEVLRPREAKRRMVEYLKPLAESGRILVVVSGNHEQRTNRDSDQDLTYDICAKLNIEHLYRENFAAMNIGVGKRKNEDKSVSSYNFFITHGTGGGIYTGAAVTRDERFGGVIDGLDCLITGHVHKGFVDKPAKIVIDSRNRTVAMKSYVVVSCVPWLNYGGYAARAQLLPAQICDPQRLTLTADRNNKRIITTW